MGAFGDCREASKRECFMNKEYRLEIADMDEKWDNFVQGSPNGTIYSSTKYLQASNIKYKLYYCYKKNELRAGVALIENETKDSTVLDDFVIYNGILYNKPTNNQNHAQQFSEQFKIQEFIATELIKIYKKVQMRLHTSIVDIRAFLWVNYGENRPKYLPDIRYTTFVNISDFRTVKKIDQISTYTRSSTSRRQQIRYALNKGYVTKCTEDSQLFIELYEKTMNRQNIKINILKLQRMKSLIDVLLQANIGKIYANYDEFGKLGSMAVFAWDTKRAYYIFGANNPQMRESHCGSSILWDAFYDLSNMGINEVDMEGINSPQRGWFKLSFGGSIIPYYSMKYDS